MQNKGFAITKRWQRRAAAAVIALAIAAAFPARAADAIYPLAMRTGLVPPPGMQASRTFPGFEDDVRKATIAITELPLAAYSEVENAIFSGALNKEIVIEKREMLPVAAGFAILLSGHQQEDGARYRKWLLFALSDEFTALVAVQVAEAAREAYPDTLMRETLASVTFRPAPIDEQLALMPFKLRDLAGFRVMRALPAGAVVLTDGPKNDDTTDQPHIIVSLSPGGPQDNSDRESFAQRLLTSTPAVSDMRVVMREPMRIGGQPGNEIRVEGKDARTGTPMMLVQWLRFGTGGFMRIVGITRKDTWPEMFPRFRAVRDGIDTK